MSSEPKKQKGLLQIWAKRNQIAEGIKNSIFKTEHVEEIAAARAEICNNCDDIDREGSKCLVPGTQPCCGICGCKLAFLQRSLSSGCEAGKWQPVLTEQEESDLKKSINYSDDEHIQTTN